MTTTSAGRTAADPVLDTTATTTDTTTTAAADTTLPLADVDLLKASVQSFSQPPPATPLDTPSPPLVNAADDSYYWDPATMAPLNARSAAAVARLRAFHPPAFPLWDRLPLSRRAAVLVLLYADRRGDLRVVLTMRAASLRSYSGHAAFPGGKADTLDETPLQIARREAFEEIGLPMDDALLPRRYRIEHLCDLPHNLAKTELVVRPCIALLHTDGAPTQAGSATATTTATAPSDETSADEALMPRLDAKEVAAVFSAPFHNFLLDTDELAPEDGAPLALAQAGKGKGEAAAGRRPKLPPGPWYEGSWVHWQAEPWRMHFFYVPVVGQRVAKPKKRLGADAQSESSESSEQNGQDDEIEDPPGRYKVWGMTGRILVDAAKIAYDEAPSFHHNAHFGDESIIEGMEKMGRLGEKKPSSERTNEDTKDASKM